MLRPPADAAAEQKRDKVAAAPPSLLPVEREEPRRSEPRGEVDVSNLTRELTQSMIKVQQSLQQEYEKPEQHRGAAEGGGPAAAAAAAAAAERRRGEQQQQAALVKQQGFDFDVAEAAAAFRCDAAAGEPPTLLHGLQGLGGGGAPGLQRHSPALAEIIDLEMNLLRSRQIGVEKPPADGGQHTQGVRRWVGPFAAPGPGGPGPAPGLTSIGAGLPLSLSSEAGAPGLTLNEGLSGQLSSETSGAGPADGRSPLGAPALIGGTPLSAVSWSRTVGSSSIGHSTLPSAPGGYNRDAPPRTPSKESAEPILASGAGAGGVGETTPALPGPGPLPGPGSRAAAASAVTLGFSDEDEDDLDGDGTAAAEDRRRGSHSSLGSAEGSSGGAAVVASEAFLHDIAEFSRAAAALGSTNGEVTLMVRNIPARYSQDRLLSDWQPDGTYDMIYLPFDFAHRHHKGYAFVNFPSAGNAHKFFIRWHKSRLRHHGPGKKLNICLAEVQGRTKNLRQMLNNKVYRITNPSLQPALFEGTARVNLDDILAVVGYAATP